MTKPNFKAHLLKPPKPTKGSLEYFSIHNPKTQQKIKIPAKTVVKFRVAKAAKDGVLGVKK